MTEEDSYESFTLVLAGGGARGFAHAGILRALESEGLQPDAIVGVSMGAVVGTTYGLRKNWYSELVELDTSQFPKPMSPQKRKTTSFLTWIGDFYTYLRLVLTFFLGWGVSETIYRHSLRILKELTHGKKLEETRIPVVVCATDLKSGSRVDLRSGPTADAVLASASIAGVFPPQRRGDQLLIDGAYADMAPVDVASEFSAEKVVVVDPSQSLSSTEVRNGLQAILRAVEICQMRHADLRFEKADCVLRPEFDRTIDTFDFDSKRDCVAAGIRSVRKNRDDLKQVLETSSQAGRIH